MRAIFSGRIGFELASFKDCHIGLHGDLVDGGFISFYAATVISGEIDVTTPRGMGGISFLDLEMQGGTISLYNLELTGDDKSANFAMSRSNLSGGTFRLLGGTFASGDAYFQGLTMAGGRLIIGSDPEYGPTPEYGRKRFLTSLCGTRFVFDNVLIEEGLIGFIDVRLDGSRIDFNNLQMAGGEISFLGSTLKSGVVDFPKSVDMRGGVVSLEEVEEDGATLNLVGLGQEQTSDE